MFFTRTEGRKTRRNRPTTGIRPALEGMEGRQLLTAFMYANSAAVVEHGTSSVTMDYMINLTSPSSTPVTVDYQTQDNTGKAGTDYQAASGTVTFVPGQTTAVVQMTVLADPTATSNKSFYVNLSNAQGAYVLTPTLVGTIFEENTPPPPALSITNASVMLGTNDTPGTMTFTATLNTPLDYAVTVDEATSDLTAVAGTNYVAENQTLTFAPGQTAAKFTVAINGSTIPSLDIFLVTMSNSNVHIATSQAGGFINY